MRLLNGVLEPPDPTCWRAATVYAAVCVSAPIVFFEETSSYFLVIFIFK